MGIGDAEKKNEQGCSQPFQKNREREDKVHEGRERSPVEKEVTET